MIKSKIEWTDYSINIIKGYCPNTCSYCYSHRMYNRFKWDKTIRYDVNELKKLKSIKEPSRIFVGSMIDMYHPDIPSRWVREIIKITRNYPGHTFITLTKYPNKLSTYSFPENWWVGVTVDKNRISSICVLEGLDIKGKKFISFEPLLESMEYTYPDDVDWIIIGGLTGSKKWYPPEEWIKYIEQRADKFGIPIFEKNNLRNDWKQSWRKEFPK